TRLGLDFSHTIGMVLGVYRKPLETYRAVESEVFDRHYIERWRAAFLNPPKPVEHAEEVCLKSCVTRLSGLLRRSVQGVVCFSSGCQIIIDGAEGRLQSYLRPLRRADCPGHDGKSRAGSQSLGHRP